MRKLHDGEPDIDTGLARRLVAARFPHWAHLPVTESGAVGTANVVFRLGEELAVRLPRLPGAAADIEKDHRWLPVLGPGLPVAVPAPLALGMPAEGFPWSWSVCRWLPGCTPEPGRLPDAERFARDLGAFVTALRDAPTAGAPPAYRSETLADRDQETRAALDTLRAEIDSAAALDLWREALRAPAHAGPTGWIHADLQPGNLLLAGDRLCAVIDFGCAGLGDPAVDLIAAWYVLPSAARGTFRAAAGWSADDGVWTRARGWALSIALPELAAYRRSNPRMAAIARHVIRELLAERRSGR